MSSFFCGLLAKPQPVEKKVRVAPSATLKFAIASRTDDLVANVASGSVILSGTVVEQVKEIPGVHEITFELALEEIAS